MKIKFIFLIILGLIVLYLFISGTLFLLVFRKSPEQRQLVLIKTDIKDTLESVRYFLRTRRDANKPPSVYLYYEPRLQESIKFLEGKETLEKPYVLMAYFGFYDQKEIGGRLWLSIKWVEIGFNSRGARIYCNKDGEGEMVDLPFPEYDEEDKRFLTTEEAIRSCPYSYAEIGKSWSYDNNDLKFKISVPEYVFNDNVQTYVTIYTKDGKESNPLELHIQKELKDYILEQDKLKTKINSK